MLKQWVLIAGSIGLLAGCSAESSVRANDAASTPERQARAEPAATMPVGDDSPPATMEFDSAPAPAPGDAAQPAVAQTELPQTQPEASSGPRRVEAFPGVAVFPDENLIEIDATVCLDGGWLEQIACSPGTREHEALVVIEAKPSEIHASLLLAGFESGRPGRWVYEKDKYWTEPPEGDALNVFVRYEQDGESIEKPIGAWIVDHQGNHKFPDAPWVFGGSSFATNPPEMGEGEYYVADYSGSIIGLVTFGDEVLGFAEVLSDQTDVQPAAWVVNEDAIPAVGTKVTIVLRKAKTTDDE